MESFKAYWIYWGASFATMITWVFAVAAAADDAWLSFNGATSLELGEDCSHGNSIGELYDAATTFQFIATTIVSFALVVVVIAAFASPSTTGLLGLALGIMLAVFSLFQMFAFSLMASAIKKLDDTLILRGFDDFEAGPTLGVAVMAWLFGLAGTITTLALRSRATNKHDGPFRNGMPPEGDIAEAGQYVGTV